MTQSFFSGKRVMFAAGFLSSFFLLFAILALEAYNRHRSIAEQRASGLASMREAQPGWEPVSLWRQTRLIDYVVPERRPAMLQKGVSGGQYFGVAAMVPDEDKAASRKVARNASLSLAVNKTKDALSQAQGIAEQLGGYVTSSDANLAGGATIVLLVPANQLDEALARLKALSLTVEAEHTAAEDVTRQSHDMEAALVNARAAEAQYRDLLKRAGSIPDIMAVTQKLTEVRTDIDQKQAQLRMLQQQIEMSRIEVSVHETAETQIAGFQWRPSYRLKIAAHDAADSIADYVSVMVGLLAFLPALLLWLATGLFLVLAGVRTAGWVWERVRHQ